MNKFKIVNLAFLPVLMVLSVGFSSLYAQPTPWDSKIDHLAPEPPPSESPAVPQGELKVKTPPPEAGRPDGQTVIMQSLKGLVLIDSAEKLVRLGISGVSGVDIRGPRVPDPEGLATRLKLYFGQPLTLDGANRITETISSHYLENDRPFVQVLLPSGQRVADDTLQILVVEAVVGHISAKGNQHYTEKQLVRQMRQKTDMPIHRSVLEDDILWLNNSFRKVSIVAQKGKQKGTADLEITVNDKKPWSVSAGYNDTGNKLTGYSRFNVGFNHANLFRRDHQIGYKYTQAEDYDDFNSHFLTYTAPIQSLRHTVNGFLSYSETRSSYSLTGLDSTTTGESLQAGLRYKIPIIFKIKDKQNLSIGIDYKKSDNTYDYIFNGFEFSGTPTTTETVQFITGYDLFKNYDDNSRFPGVFTLDGRIIYSPGGITSDNDAEAYRLTNMYADPEYVYAKLDLSRSFRFSNNSLFNLSISSQYAPETLLSGEQITITGRGYDPSELSGDYGVMTVAELYAPSFSLSEKTGLKFFKDDQLRLFAFMEYGWAGLHNPYGNEKNLEACSAGAGLKWSVGSHFFLSFEYGWKLIETDVSEINYDRGSSRGHINLSLNW